MGEPEDPQRKKKNYIHVSPAEAQAGVSCYSLVGSKAFVGCVYDVGLSFSAANTCELDFGSPTRVHLDPPFSDTLGSIVSR